MNIEGGKVLNNFDIASFEKELGVLGIYSGAVPDDSCVSSIFWQECGYTCEEQETLDWLDCVKPEDRMMVEQAWNGFILGKTDLFDQTYRFATKNGKWIWNRSRCTALKRNPDNSVTHFIGIQNDITHMKATERELNRAKDIADKRASESETLRKVVAIIAGCLKESETVSIVFEQARKLIDYTYATVEVPTPSGIEITGGYGFSDNPAGTGASYPHPDDDNPVSIILQKNTAVVVQDMMQEYPDYPVLKLTEVPIRSWIGVPLHLNEKTVGVLTFGHERKGLFRGRDLTLLQALADHVAIALENARLHEKIYRLAMVDPLMGIGSRHNFNHQGHLLFAQAKRYRRELSLLIIDVDHFKKINDTYGHDTGDIVLKKIAAACSGVLRDSDMIARYGGEEIVVLLPETGLTQGILVAERIRESITMMDVDLIEWTVTASIGIYAGIPDPDGTLDQYLQNADEALYQAKECGRNCVRYIR